MKRDLITTNGEYRPALLFGDVLVVDDVLFTNGRDYLYYRVDLQRYWWIPRDGSIYGDAGSAEEGLVKVATSYKYNVGDVVGNFTVVAQLPYLWNNTDVCYVVKSRGGIIEWVQEQYVGCCSTYQGSTQAEYDKGWF